MSSLTPRSRWFLTVSFVFVAALMAGFTLLNEVFGPKKGDTAAG
jgi:hypothetical protein